MGVSIKVGVSVPTPCGDIQVYKVVTVPFSIDFDFWLHLFPLTFHIPFPDCSMLCRLNSAPEPPEDSVP